MATYAVRVDWSCSGDFLAETYSRAHTWTFDGGATVAASASSHNVSGPYTDPTAVDPEEALVAAVSSCHMLWFLWLAAKGGWQVEHYRDNAVGVLGKDDRERIAITKVTLNPLIAFRGRAATTSELRELHHKAHENCFIASSLRGDVIVTCFNTSVVD